MTSQSVPPPGDRLAELLRRELHTARSSALDGGADPDEVTADLTERVQRLRRLNAAGWTPSGERHEPAPDVDRDATAGGAEPPAGTVPRE